ncbi:MAG: hypothetical protein R3B54_04985 [Bdellovibrionota bacterium]
MVEAKQKAKSLLGILAKYRAGHSVDWAGSDSCRPNQQIEFAEWEGAGRLPVRLGGATSGQGF